MSSLTSCPYCERLYTRHSLDIHIPKCRSNPSVIITRSSSVSEPRKKKSKKDRPRTRSICRHQKVDFRICLICGDQVSPSFIEEHERLCLEKWDFFSKELASRFETRRPLALKIPSLDGSLDFQRLNVHAVEQSRKAQNARCRRCQIIVPLVSAIDHRCTRFEPAVEFFF